MEEKKDASVEVIIVGILLAVVLLIGTPVFGKTISGRDSNQEVKAVPVAAEHIAY